MAKLGQSIHVEASLAETWDHYFEPRGWPAWVDGFDRVESASGYPEEGGALVWASTPAGRGTVREQVLEHRPRTLHRIDFSDPSSSGRLTTRFEARGQGTEVTLELEYELAKRGALARITDRLFVRGQVSGSLARTLARFKHEVEELAALARTTPPAV